jgi:hypothetical protein
MCISYSILLKYYFFFYFFNNLYFSSLSCFHLSLFSKCQSLPLWLWAWICNFGALFIVGRGRRWRPTDGSAMRRRTLLSLFALPFQTEITRRVLLQRSRPAQPRGRFFSSEHDDRELFDGVLGTLAHTFSPPNGQFHLDAAET